MSVSPPAPPVLLLGAVAEAMASRLEISGYRVLTELDLPDDAPGIAAGVPAAAHGEGRQAAQDPAGTVPAAIVLSPGCEGRIARLRSRWHSTPLLLGIPADTVPGRSHCLRCGADDFWLTGMAPSDLLTRLRLHLNLRSIRHQSVQLLVEGDLQVDPQRHQVRRGNRSIPLTVREYQLLLLLLLHRGRLLRRETILREIWSDPSQAGSNVIEVYIRYLRRKLEAEGEPRLIHTIRGLGYCLDQQVPAPGRFVP